MLELSFMDWIKAFGALSGVVLFVLGVVWAMFIQPRVKKMMNALDIRRDTKHTEFVKAQNEKNLLLFAEKENTGLKFNTLDNKQEGDDKEIVELKRRIVKLENGG